MNEKLSKMLNEVFLWAQTIRIEANKNKDDEIDDSALIIQELIEAYIQSEGINPRQIIDYQGVGIEKIQY